MEFPGFKKITLESGITSESLKREAVEQQLLYMSYERKWQSHIRALTGAPGLLVVLMATSHNYQYNFVLSTEFIM